jgi:hypothetical protein
MIINLTSVNSDSKDNSISPSVRKQCTVSMGTNSNVITTHQHVDIKTILANAKNDKRFHKLLVLCIKYNIHIFNYHNNTCSLLSVNEILLKCDNKQKILTKELADKIMNIYITGSQNGWLVDIENIYIQFKKKFKEINVIVYLLKNIYDDQTLEKLCLSNDEQLKKIRSDKKEKLCLLKVEQLKKLRSDKNKTSKYIDIYSN